MVDQRVLTFITLCKHKSYTKASQELCITQPAVTQHIKYLERYYDVKLVDQTSKRFKLTVAGEHFLAYCLHIYNYSTQIEKVLQTIEGEAIHLTFGATLSIGGYLLPDIIKKYMLVHPKDPINMIVENTESLLKRLTKGEIDFAFVEGYFNKADFASRVLKREAFILVVSKDHPLAKQTKVTLKELRKERLIIRERGSGTRAILENGLQELNEDIKNFKSIMEIGSLQVIKDMVKSNLGISFMYKTVAKEELKSGTLCEIAVENMTITRAFNFVYMKDAILEKQYKDFFEFISSNL